MFQVIIYLKKVSFKKKKGSNLYNYFCNFLNYMGKICFCMLYPAQADKDRPKTTCRFWCFHKTEIAFLLFPRRSVEYPIWVLLSVAFLQMDVKGLKFLGQYCRLAVSGHHEVGLSTLCLRWQRWEECIQYDDPFRLEKMECALCVCKCTFLMLCCVF